MEDPARATGSRQQHGGGGGGGEHPVRSRWTPKPEQILILETIFNSGMVNPPKDETVRIRKLLEKFGSVADANVFYWFQNRRSRSRRRQRQLQAAPAANPPIHYDQHTFAASAAAPPDSSFPSSFSNHSMSSIPYSGASSSPSSSSSSSFGFDSNSLFGVSTYPGLMQEFEQNPIFSSAQPHNSPIRSEVMTVFINGVATEVGRGPLDMKSLFGVEYVLFHSSGVPVEMNEYGFLVQGLEHGESYFLVPRQP